ncbi:hypothetical protein GQ43DRAFT_384040 [Delitschia confertaspora ATCC 74209]|uniref:Zn(2)-C6 fungal-type domain-containing protein n=1 Tax=Delitschia confertaspora ATCC 74209 TaxID=1513339 RepID=A0A9P4MMH5_9PLEO|nr:hypothetical protein GQ43DRAFT_384040 [Delitschia confertaspora ATCC 74209]
MAEQNDPHSRQQSTSYPSPHSYPSPSMQPTYNYPPPQGQSNPEPYRESPQAANMSLPSLNLPPIRMPDGQSQQPPQPQHGPPPMGSPLPPPPVNGMGQYYAHPGHPPPPGPPMNMTSSPHNPNMAMRYQLPPNQEPRMMSGGRHKKEIKRRTKTGCLTCRKRRIKCDEAHPVCRNCQKSKRECLGYDPIFKQQPGPAQIQPAPSAAPHQASVPASAPPSSLPYGAGVPQGYAPAASAAYAPPVPAPGSGHSAYEPAFNSAIDPALAATDPAMYGGQPAYNGNQAINPALGSMGSASPYSDAPPMKGSCAAKPIKISDLFPIGGHSPPEVPQRTGPVPPELDDEFAQIYTRDYCLGLDAILETRWFSTNHIALNKIFADKALHEEVAHFVETVKYPSNSMQDGMARVFGQEARLIWHLLGVCKQTAPVVTNGTNGTAPANPETDDFALKEVRARFDIMEALMTNQNLESNPLAQLSYPPELVEAKKPEIDFWEQLGNFVVYADLESAPAGAVEQALGIMRQVLHQIEARDVIYSIAIARSSGGRVRGFPHTLPRPVDNNPENDVNKLDVAMRFILHESRASSQQVIARICDMAQLSWSVSRTQ